MNRRIALALTLLAATAAAQQPGSPTYDVATIKPSAPGESNRSLGIDHRHFLAHFVTFSQLMQYAYAIQQKQIINEPKWADTETFDIDVQSEAAELPMTQWRVILQKFLADRFTLKTHNEQQVMPAYILTVAKNGPKFEQLKDIPGHQPGVGMMRGPHQWLRISGYHTTMAELAAQLQRVELDRPAVDKTGLTGNFDFTVTATSFKPFFTDDAPDPTDNAPAGLFTALQEQLGLKLEPARTAVQCLVIDTIQQPSAN